MITLIPIGDCSKSAIEYIRDNLFFRSMPICLRSKITFPDTSFDPRRAQYDAKPILDLISIYQGKKVLGVVDRDLFVPELNFVFGLARKGGRVALISLTRLKENCTSYVFLKRALKEANHELGHTFGLSHCRDPDCVMFFSNCLDDTDRKGTEPCGKCIGLIKNTCY